MKSQSDLISERLKVIFDKVSLCAQKTGRTFDDINIMAVTKTVSPELVNIAVHSGGIKLLGENRVQEYLSKMNNYDIDKERVHFIGNLQSNKIKHIIGNVGMIESVSSLQLLNNIDGAAFNIGVKMPVLLEVNIGNEESKSGFLKDEVLDIVYKASEKKNVLLQGLMCIPPKEGYEVCFEEMYSVFENIKNKKIENVEMKYLSMGMSRDYESALLHGANIIRLGQAIFGERKYGGN